VITTAQETRVHREQARVGSARFQIAANELALGWHVLEATVAVAAGVVAGSVALVGFDADSLIEAAAGLVVLWLVTGERLASHHAERRPSS
jgi:hypothetical protein